MNRKCIAVLMVSLLIGYLAPGCDGPSKEKAGPLKVGMVLNTGGENDHGFNEYSLLGAENAAKEVGLELAYVVSKSKADFDENIKKMADQGADLIFTMGFDLAEATAKAAKAWPDRHFVIMDYAYYPGSGCPQGVDSCYTKAGGLVNVTSLVFKEDQPAFLAGALAACMSRTNTLGIVAGEQIPPVIRLAEGFENGARSVNPDITLHKIFIPNFNDPKTGRTVGEKFITQGADLLFCPAGTTGLGGLMAAKDAGIMAIGVDVDQYLTYPQAKSALITSVVKNVDIAAQVVVSQFAAGTLKPGIQAFDLKSDAVGLAPYHEWEDRVSQKCRDIVALTNKQVVIDPDITGAAQ